VFVAPRLGIEPGLLKRKDPLLSFASASLVVGTVSGVPSTVQLLLEPLVIA